MIRWACIVAAVGLGLIAALVVASVWWAFEGPT